MILLEKYIKAFLKEAASTAIVKRASDITGQGQHQSAASYSKDMTGKVVIVTGSSNGIGKTCALDLIEKKKDQFVPQDNSKATYAKKIDKQETKINWYSSAKKLIAKINAFYPSPGAWFMLNKSRIKILKAEEIEIIGKPGEIIDKDLIIGCSENSIKILELKKEGKKSMKTKEFLAGNFVKIGTFLND